MNHPDPRRTLRPIPTTGRTDRCVRLVGNSPQSRALFREIRLLAGEHCPVLIHGETGTGKELVAEALHQVGRPGRPWVAVNCAAISETLANSELFGHEKGAFTGAIGRHEGAFERADGGTLFLDEIGELSLPLQAKLLRVLESKEIHRTGGGKPVKSNFRLVAATHRDLLREVAAGRFRQDLLFRLGVAVVEIAPLRERLEELPLLATELLGREGGGLLQLAEDAIAKLRRHTWPGNVRELANVLTRGRLRCMGGTLRASDLILPTIDRAYPIRTEWPVEQVCEPPASWGMVKIEGRTLAEIEREVILHTLRVCGGNQAEAARRLGMPRQTLNDRLHRLGNVPATVHRIHPLADESDQAVA